MPIIPKAHCRQVKIRDTSSGLVKTLRLESMNERHNLQLTEKFPSIDTDYETFPPSFEDPRCYGS